MCEQVDPQYLSWQQRQWHAQEWPNQHHHDLGGTTRHTEQQKPPYIGVDSAAL
jgi:hypothetical protein